MYPVYKLIRAINRQYPNNGFISAVDVTEETNDGLIPEDFRDLLNETIQEIYHDIAIDEMFSFPTVPGQREYALPEDCDLRDIQEVTRTFAIKPYGPPPPPPPPPPVQRTCAMMFDANGGLGEMEPVVVDYGTQYVLPECTFIPPTGKVFIGWGVDGSEYGEPPKIYQPGEAVDADIDLTITAVWGTREYIVTVYISTVDGIGIIKHKPWGGELEETTLVYGGVPYSFRLPADKTVADLYEVLAVYDDTGENLCLDITEEVIEDDTDIGVAVPTTIIPAEPVVDPAPEEPIDDPAVPVVDPDTEEPIE